jgi:glycerophosphoryl diester phosphodiesterase
MDTHSDQQSLDSLIANTGGYPVAGVHRGGAPHIGPENTLPAFRRSVALGTRLLELDVRLTADHVPVLMHDSAVGRTTNGEGDVRDYRLTEIQRLDAAYWTEWRGQGIGVPTLEEFFAEFVPHEQLIFLLDFKDTKAVMMTLDVMYSFHIEHRVMMGSVFGPVNQALFRVRPCHSIPICTDTLTTMKIVMAHSLGLLTHHYTATHQLFGFILREETRRFWTRDLVDQVHALGMRIMVCGSDLDDPAVLRQCIEWECEFILTDSPDVLQKVLLIDTQQ